MVSDSQQAYLNGLKISEQDILTSLLFKKWLVFLHQTFFCFFDQILLRFQWLDDNLSTDKLLFGFIVVLKIRKCLFYSMIIE